MSIVAPFTAAVSGNRNWIVCDLVTPPVNNSAMKINF
jgi:hypothetical protein